VIWHKGGQKADANEPWINPQYILSRCAKLPSDRKLFTDNSRGPCSSFQRRVWMVPGCLAFWPRQSHDRVQELAETKLSEWTPPLCNAVLWCNVYWAWVPGNIGCVRSRIFDSTESAMIDDKSVQCLCTSTIFMQYTHWRWCLRETCCQFRHRDHTETSCELWLTAY